MPVSALLTLLLLLSAAPVEAALSLWIGDDKGAAGVQAVADRYQAETGQRVEVTAHANLPQAFDQALATGEGPDIVIWAHDRLGEWASRGGLQPVYPSAEFRRFTAPFVWPALTLDGELYGYPIAVEAVGLIYNRKLLPHPPLDFEHLFALHPQLRAEGVKTIAWDYTNPYFSWGLLSSGDSFSLRATDDGFATGIDSADAKRGARLLQRLLVDGVMAAELNGSRAAEAFKRGELAMTINGPWSWQAFRNAGIDMGVVPLPRVQGQRSRVFVGVWAAAITRFAGDQHTAADFIENYLLSLEGLRRINAEVSLGPVANRQLMKELAADPAVDQAFIAAVSGELMPNRGPVSAFWRALQQALVRMTREAEAPGAALEQAAARIR
ncbi:maltose/maltodextrin ABC transporter substrate-binding protein MalE [Motiliproteus sediminis]|uniref:maltose/maltodextrin ABC transporter substrate-binding protein MalE n=1 Tax=Motiliproteus sediminis TaxID=1468178 RepID=UPI001AF0136E|nr:maltose/maltodextrin ABC transporter substrate-binding protein MalE [Motiliproteus sediminis]